MSTTTTIERPATGAFEPTFAELLASEEPGLMRDPLRRWIAVHGDEGQARFVYVTWLLAARDVAPFAEPIVRWLALHVDEPDAHYVYVEWLRSGGNLDAVAGSLSSWLDRHGLIEEACWPSRRGFSALSFQGARGGQTARPLAHRAQPTGRSRSRWSVAFGVHGYIRVVSDARSKRLTRGVGCAGDERGGGSS